LKAQDELEKATFAYEQAKSNYEQQPQQNRFDIENKKALLDRQHYLVAICSGRSPRYRFNPP